MDENNNSVASDSVQPTNTDKKMTAEEIFYKQFELGKEITIPKVIIAMEEYANQQNAYDKAMQQFN